MTIQTTGIIILCFIFIMLWAALMKLYVKNKDALLLWRQPKPTDSEASKLIEIASKLDLEQRLHILREVISDPVYIQLRSGSSGNHIDACSHIPFDETDQKSKEAI